MKPRKPQPSVPSGSEIVLYQTEDGSTRIDCLFEDGAIWLTQAQIAELFQTTAQNVTLHLKAIFAGEELLEAATCKEYLQVRQEGAREVSRNLRHYHLNAILAVGFRVRSQRGTQFRQWAITRLEAMRSRLSNWQTIPMPFASCCAAFLSYPPRLIVQTTSGSEGLMLKRMMDWTSPSRICCAR